MMSMQSPIAEQIQPSVLTRLAAYAQRAGKTVNDLLKEMLDEREAAMRPKEERSFFERATPDEWSRELRAWAASHPMSTVIADDSREGIYEG
jgi:hypothetical protein